jgi:murein DD-endopeptidase MepM/ murein hydrolase activator NlpD
MFRRKLLTLLFGVALVVALAALPTASASADSRTLLVTLLGGQQITVTVDVPPGTPLDQIQIPGVSGVIVSVSEAGGPPAAPAPPATTTTPAPAPATTPTQTTPPASSTTPSTTPTTPSTTPTTPAAPGDGQPAGKPVGGDPARGPKATKDDKAQREAQKTTRAVTEAQVEDETAADHKARKHNKKTKDGDGKSRADGGEPTPANPTYTLAEPGPAPIGVPNFFIEKFRIPPFLLPIYQAAGIEYGVRWEVLAAINEIETDYGRNLNVSTAGAVGWMQFLPSTWKQYGVDANEDGRKDPYNPVDAIFAAARYLKAAGASDDLRRAIFAYNHADWYVDSVVLRARLLGGLPADFVGSLTGLTQGRFPVHARAAYADDISEREALRRVKRGQNAAVPVEAQAQRRSIDIFAKAGSPVVAVQDGTIVAMGQSRRLGRHIRLRDAYGNVYTYAHLKSVSTEYPVPKPPAEPPRANGKVSEPEQPAGHQEQKDPVPTAPASAGRQTKAQPAGKTRVHANPSRATAKSPARTGAGKERLFANPTRPNVLDAGGREQILDAGGSLGGLTSVKGYVAGVYGLKSQDVVVKRLKVGSRVIGGTILGRVGRIGDSRSPRVTFAIRPAGRGAPLIDPKPILDGWKLL